MIFIGNEKSKKMEKKYNEDAELRVLARLPFDSTHDQSKPTLRLDQMKSPHEYKGNKKNVKLVESHKFNHYFGY